jgi:hypothetical protein
VVDEPGEDGIFTDPLEYSIRHGIGTGELGPVEEAFARHLRIEK